MNAELRNHEIQEAGDGGSSSQGLVSGVPGYIAIPPHASHRLWSLADSIGPTTQPHRSLSRRGGRGVLLAAVVALHVALIALLLLPSGRQQLSRMLPAMEVQIITPSTPHRETPLPVPLSLTRPQIKLIIPEVRITEPPEDAPVAAPVVPTVSAVETASARATPGPTQPIEPPRFDAAYLKNPAPSYPPASRRLREQGTVLMRVLVSPQGTAERILIEHTSGSQRLDDAAMDAVKHWRFEPAHRGNETVEAWVLVPIEFEMRR